MSSNSNAKSSLALRRRRKSQLATIARQKEAKRLAMLDRWKIQIPVVGEERDDNPFDEGHKSVTNSSPTGSHEHSHHAPLSASTNGGPAIESSPRLTLESTLTATSKASASPNNRFLLKKQEQRRQLRKVIAQRETVAKRLSMDGAVTCSSNNRTPAKSAAPFDEGHTRERHQLDSANYSSLAHIRSQRQACDSLISNDDESRQDEASSALSLTSRQGHDMERIDSMTSLAISDIPFQKDGLRLGFRDRFQRRLGGSGQGGFLRRPLVKVIDRAPSQDLPSDEESSVEQSETQTHPSFDGENSLSTKNSDISNDIVTPFRKMAEKKAFQEVTTCPLPRQEHSLAEEVARFMLFREINMFGKEPIANDDSSVEATPSVVSQEDLVSELAEVDFTAKYAHLRFRVPSVRIQTSERIMKSLHSRSSHDASIENIVVWSLSRDGFTRADDFGTSSLLGSRYEMESIATNRDDLDFESHRFERFGPDEIIGEEECGSMSEPNGSSTTASVKSRNIENTSAEGDDTKSEWTVDHSEDGVIQPPPYAGKAKKDRDEEQMRPNNKKVWSFYDPLEVKKLARPRPMPTVQLLKDPITIERVTPEEKSPKQAQVDKPPETKTLKDSQPMVTGAASSGSEFSYGHLFTSSDSKHEGQTDSILLDKLLEKVDVDSHKTTDVIPLASNIQTSQNKIEQTVVTDPPVLLDDQSSRHSSARFSVVDGSTLSQASSIISEAIGRTETDVSEVGLNLYQEKPSSRPEIEKKDNSQRDGRTSTRSSSPKVVPRPSKLSPEEQPKASLGSPSPQEQTSTDRPPKGIATKVQPKEKNVREELKKSADSSAKAQRKATKAAHSEHHGSFSDAAIANVFGLMNKFNVEREKNKNTLNVRHTKDASSAKGFPKFWPEPKESRAAATDVREDIDSGEKRESLEEDREGAEDMREQSERRDESTRDDVDIPSEHLREILDLSLSSGESKEDTENQTSCGSDMRIFAGSDKYFVKEQEVSFVLPYTSKANASRNENVLLNNVSFNPSVDTEEFTDNTYRTRSTYSGSDSSVSSDSDTATYSSIEPRRRSKYGLVPRQTRGLNIAAMEEALGNQMIALLSETSKTNIGAVEDMLWERGLMCRCNAVSFDE